MQRLTKQYRDAVYRLRAHPSQVDFIDQRDSWGRVYASILPFLILEYFVEASFHVAFSGLVFPLGFLLFWAFYYSYYRPGLLEEKLSAPAELDFAGVLALVLGTAIWFVKVSVFGVIDLLLRTPGKPSTPKPVQRPAAHTTHFTQAPPRRPEPARPTVPPLPEEIRLALRDLGIPECRDWAEIHRRYRELAKRLHPDLNPEITSAGRRFVKIDSAYRKLEKVRGAYFTVPGTRSHG